MKVKSLLIRGAKSFLRSFGLLKTVRRIMYRMKYRKINRLIGNQVFSFEYLGLSPVFTLIDPYSLTFFSYYFKESIYEEAALRLILERAQDGATFADVGANIGYFSIMAALKAPYGKVIAFELGSENCVIMLENVKLNGLKNIELVHGAVSDLDGLVYCIDSPVGNAVLKIIEITNQRNSDLVAVQAVTLDSFFMGKQVPNFVKIDVEGAELKVLKGMRRIAPDIREMLIEIHPKDLVTFGGSEEEVLTELKTMGYEFREIQKDVQKNRLLHAYRKDKK